MPTNFGTLEPLNQEKFLEEFNALEEDARQEKITSLIKERNDIRDANRELFGRAKRSEGFEEDAEGNWIKTIKEKPKAEKPGKSDDKLLERLDKMALQVAGINEADEVELFEKWKTETNREADTIVGSSLFQKELGEIRTAKANLAATSDIKGEKGESGVKGNPDYWIAKATKGPDGKLLFPEETPKELYSKIVARFAEKEPGSSGKLEFYNQ